jgi:hypothetical protein
MSGIEVSTLVALVKNTAPFLWNPTPTNSTTRYRSILMDTENAPDSISEDLPRYYELCIAAHFASVATFVPTDVDIAIRQKLWQKVHHPEAFLKLWTLVQEFYTWDESLVSKRFLITARGNKISGHQGEWFSIAVGAYKTALKLTPDYVPEIRQSIEDCVHLHEKVLLDLEEIFMEERDATSLKNLCLAIAMTAHNLGDLDRMIEAWQLEDTDVLKRRVFRAGHEDARTPLPLCVKYGKIYQQFLAAENHRHFALREPKGLRKSADFLLPSGPFFDQWGLDLVNGTQQDLLNERELREIIQALIEGWDRLNPKSIYTSVGYARALHGIQSGLKKTPLNGIGDLLLMVPPRHAKKIQEGGLRTHLGITQKSFEEGWVKKIRLAVMADRQTG